MRLTYLLADLKCRYLGRHTWLYGERKFSIAGEERRVCVACGRLEVDDHDGLGYTAAE